jgi:hypothetical protein
MPIEHDVTFRKYAWDFFDLHAAQRLKTFQFYITLSAALIGGLFAFNHDASTPPRNWMIAIGLSLSFLSFIFYKLDVRTKELISVAVKALEFLDAQYGFENIDGKPHPLRLFDVNNAQIESHPTWPITKSHFTYTRCFQWVFTSFGTSGLLLAYYCYAYLKTP